MKKKVARFFKYFFLLSVTILLILLAFRGVDFKRVVAEIFKANVGWVMLSLLPSMIAFVSRAYRWNLLIEPLGHRPRLRKTTYAVLVGYFANFAFPRLGEVTRCGTLSRSERIPFNALLGTVVTERIVDVISLFICLAITAAIEYKRLGDFLLQNIVKSFGRKLTTLVSSPLFWIAMVAIGVLGLYLVRSFKSKALGKGAGIFQIIKGVVDGLKTIGSLKRPWLFLWHSVFIWALYYLSMYLCFFALPATAHLNLSAALFLLVAGGIGMSAPVQGGIGIYHLLVSQGLMLYGLSKQDGLAFATLVHSSQMILVIVFGSISLLLLLIENKNLDSEKEKKKNHNIMERL